MPIVQGNDVIAQSQSGSGKTGAFVIGTLQGIDYSIPEIQVLVLAPTRELAQQIYDVYSFIGEFLKVKQCILIGGTNFKESLKKTGEWCTYNSRFSWKSIGLVKKE